MKPTDFEYFRPQSIEEVLEILASQPEETKILAGGQSLLPMMNLRLVRPQRVVDINAVQGLDTIAPQPGGTLRLGTLVRHHTLEVDPTLQDELPGAAEVASQVGHLQIRMRGTLGGSLVHADPSAELPAFMTLLDARMLLRRADGTTHTLAADDFFLGPLTTAVGADELLTAIELTPPGPDAGWATLEVARTHGAYALAGATTFVVLDEKGQIEELRLALFGVEDVPYLADWIGEIAHGQETDTDLFDRIGQRVRESVDPMGDATISADYRRHTAGTLASRVVKLASRRAEGKLEGA